MALAGEIIRGGDVPGSLTAYTPTITGSTSGTWSAGSTVITAYYVRAGDWIETWVDLALGASVSITGSTSGTLYFSLPVTGSSTLISPMVFGNGFIIKASATAANYTTTIHMQDTGKVFMRRIGDGSVTSAAGTTIQNNTFTYASGDRISYNLRYMAA